MHTTLYLCQFYGISLLVEFYGLQNRTYDDDDPTEKDLHAWSEMEILSSQKALFFEATS